MIKKIILFIFLLPNILFAGGNLFFVGQNLNIISVISDRPELPNRTPADVLIINNSNDIYKINNKIMGILNDIPGFYIEEINGIDRLYFRGLKNSLLFLYDGVPITSDATKNLLPSDFTLNKDLFSRFEIVSGASSVFWGPDAFSGVINMVPDELSENKNEFSIITGNKENGSYFKKFFQIDKIYGTLGLSFLNSKQHYHNNNIESYGKIHLFDNFNLTFHISDYDSNYKTKYNDKNKWKSSYKYPFNLIKIEYLKKFLHTSFKLKSYFLDLKSRYEEDYFHWKQHSNTYFYGFRISRDLFNNNGLLTIGASYKKTKTFNSDVVVRGFIPDYIINKNSFFSPLSDKVSFNSYLKSYYAQYVHNFKNFEVWSGIRYDDHSKYSSVTNWNLGFGGFFKNYYFKLNYATAFRTPIAEKFVSRKDINPEKIRMLSFSNNFTFKEFSLKLTGFYQKVNHRIYEDKYGGFSEPGEDKIYGIETGLTVVFNKLKIWTNFTGLKQTGDDETYKILKYILIIPGKNPEFVYDYKRRNFDYGAKYFGTLGVKYNFKNINLYGKLNWYKNRHFYYLHNEKSFYKNFVFNSDVAIEYMYHKKMNLILKFNNILNNNKKIPGNYKKENQEGTSFEVNLKFLF